MLSSKAESDFFKLFNRFNVEYNLIGLPVTFLSNGLDWHELFHKISDESSALKAEVENNLIFLGEQNTQVDNYLDKIIDKLIAFRDWLYTNPTEIYLPINEEEINEKGFGIFLYKHHLYNINYLIDYCQNKKKGIIITEITTKKIATLYSSKVVIRIFSELRDRKYILFDEGSLEEWIYAVFYLPDVTAIKEGKVFKAKPNVSAISLTELIGKLWDINFFNPTDKSNKSELYEWVINNFTDNKNIKIKTVLDNLRHNRHQTVSAFHIKVKEGGGDIEFIIKR